MRLLIFGSRSWTDDREIGRYLAGRDPETVTIIHGGARGADSIAARIAEDWGFKVERWPADWAMRGKSAGPIRNQAMLDSGIDRAGCFWDGSSTGTADMLRRLNQAGVPVDLHKAVVAA